MWTTLTAELLLLATCAFALPEIGIQKRDRHNHGRTEDVARGVVMKRGLARRAGTVGTNVFDILTYSEGGAYYANITVGSNAQPQTVILDTGSSDLYFDASSAAPCQTHGRYACKGGTFDPGSSSSYKTVIPSPAFNTRFGDGTTAKGPFGRDTVCLSDICLDNVQFGVAEQINTTTGFSLGLMGIGYSAIEATRHKYPNMPEVLKDAGVINSRLYSVYLNDADNGQGSVLFGGIDTSKYTGPLQTFDILEDLITNEVDQFITTVTGLGVTVGGKKRTVFSGGAAGMEAYSRNGGSLPVLLDTGSSAWSVPVKYYEAIVANFPYVNVREGVCPCSRRSSGDSLTVQFGGQLDITVTADEFILPIYDPVTKAQIPLNNQGDYACAFMIVPSAGTGEGFQTLGDAVLRSMYLVYDLDNGQVSLAQANLNSTAAPSVQIVQAGPNGVANAAKDVKVASASQSFHIASAVPAATNTFVAHTEKTTVGAATGTAAVPADAKPSGSSSGSSGSGSGSGNKNAAAAVRPPVADWSSATAMGFAVFMAVVGARFIM